MDRRTLLYRAAPGTAPLFLPDRPGAAGVAAAPCALGRGTTFAERDAGASAFERLALPHLGDVARFARALTRDAAHADDLAQETYLQALRGWHTFRPDADARRWLFTVCHHTFLRTARREARYVDAPDTGAARERVQPPTAGDAAEQMDMGDALTRALAALAAHYRGAVVLVDVEGQSYEAAALTLGVAVGTVRSRLFRGRRLLQHGLRVYAYDAGLLTPRVARRARPRRGHTP